MRLLVLSVNYPTLNGGVSLMYIHTRNRYYVEHGVDVDVISAAARESYTIDGVRVIPLSEYESNPKEYELLVLHAAEMNFHFPFIKKYGEFFKKYLFFYHGHEVLNVNKVYSKPYPYLAKHHIAAYIHQELHDIRKLANWRHTLPRIKAKSYHIFVSNWMYDEFLKNTKISPKIIEGRYYITYNCVGSEFEKAVFDTSAEKRYDFLTIRGNIDGSKYCVDVVNKLAWDNPDKRFLLIGKGRFFDYNAKAPNLEWINSTMSHNDIVKAIQMSKVGLMPTRTDSQGLMMCEMAAMGMPVITSDIPVCHEIFNGVKSIRFIDNRSPVLPQDTTYESITIKDERFYLKNTVSVELDIIKSISIQ